RRHRAAVGRICPERDRPLARADGADQPESRATQPDAHPRPGRRTHTAHTPVRPRPQKLQHPGQGAHAPGGVRPADAADGDGHLQRPHTPALGGTLDVLAVGLPESVSGRGGIANMRRFASSVAAVAAVCLLIAPAGIMARQGAASTASLTDTDLQRLRTAIADARSDVDRAKGRDSQLAATLTGQLNDLSDEVTYLSVRLKKEHSVPRSEYLDLRDRIDDVRAKAQAGQPKTDAPRAAS